MRQLAGPARGRRRGVDVVQGFFEFASLLVDEPHRQRHLVPLLYVRDDDPYVFAFSYSVCDRLDALVFQLRDMNEAITKVVDAYEGSERLDASDGAAVY